MDCVQVIKGEGKGVDRVVDECSGGVKVALRHIDVGHPIITNYADKLHITKNNAIGKGSEMN